MDDVEIKLAEEAGLVLNGKDEDGEPLFIGTKTQWQEFERLSAIRE